MIWNCLNCFAKKEKTIKQTRIVKIRNSVFLWKHVLSNSLHVLQKLTKFKKIYLPWRSCKKFWCFRKSAETDPESRPSSSDIEFSFSRIRPRTSLQSWKYLWSSLEASSIWVRVSISSPKSAQASFKASFHCAMVAASEIEILIVNLERIEFYYIHSGQKCLHSLLILVQKWTKEK